MGFVLTVTGVVLLVTLALLAVPVDLSFSFTWHRRLSARFAIAWMFGIVRVRLRPPTEEQEERKAEKRKGTKRKAWRRPLGRFYRALRTEGFVPRLARFSADVVRQIRLARLRLRGRLGFDDPADTGRLWAIMGPGTALLQAAGASVDLTPEFSNPSVELQGGGRLRVVPARLAWHTSRFLLSPPTLRAAWALVRRPRT